MLPGREVGSVRLGGHPVYAAGLYADVDFGCGVYTSKVSYRIAGTGVHRRSLFSGLDALEIVDRRLEDVPTLENVTLCLLALDARPASRGLVVVCGECLFEAKEACIGYQYENS
jgi:hypothetical protein